MIILVSFLVRQCLAGIVFQRLESPKVLPCLLTTTSDMDTFLGESGFPNFLPKSFVKLLVYLIK
jgi:hypothetical protein